jgi:Sulfotransferase family
MVLCAGPQSSGSTLVSWCFLQRPDTAGVLDMENDVLRVSFDDQGGPLLWCKMTIGAFRWIEVAELYRDLGHRPAPLLVVRDVRDVLASLVTKEYGFNGLTAEEPPLRIRLRRFLADWELFRAHGWPTLRYESLVARPRDTLREACAALDLPWHEAMLSWPKAPAEIIPLYRSGYNSTFVATVGERSLAAAIAAQQQSAAAQQQSAAAQQRSTAVQQRSAAARQPPALPGDELDWLERTFAEFNRHHGYPERVDRAGVPPGALPPPVYRDGPRRRTGGAGTVGTSLRTIPATGKGA